MAGAVEGEHFIGAKAEELRGLLKIRHPLEHGVVVDWLDMEHVWNHTYAELNVQTEDVRLFIYLNQALCLIPNCNTASRFTDRGSHESSQESRKGSRNLFRNLQCPRFLYLPPGRFKLVRPRAIAYILMDTNIPLSGTPQAEPPVRFWIQAMV